MKPDTRAVRWKRVTLVGVGLLGGSLGLALRERRLAEQIVGFVRRVPSVKECVTRGAVHQATLDLREAVNGADLIVFCTPIGQMRSLAERMLPALKEGAIVTDVGSVKGTVIQDMERVIGWGAGHFVGSHPMAGAEKMGVAAARSDLFVNAVCVVTPTRKSNPAAVREVEQLWRSVGSRLLRLAPTEHDELVSRSSHLPHLVAATLANLVLDPVYPKTQSALCANGFRDTTRIASGSPEMWRDIALANQKQIKRAFALFVRELRKLQRVIAIGDAERIEQLLAQAKSRRDDWQKDAVTASPE